MMTGAETTLSIGDREIELRFSFAALDRIEKQLGGKPLLSWMQVEENLHRAGKLADIVMISANAVKGQEKVTKEFLLENLDGAMLPDVIALIAFVIGGDERRDEYRANVAKEERRKAKEAAKEATEENESDDPAPVGPDPLSHRGAMSIGNG